MNTLAHSLLLSACATLAASALSAADPAPCCPAPAPAPAAPAACCVPEKTHTAARPTTEKSLYQLDRTWTNDAGKAVTLASLRGRPVAIAMFFAQCEYACPVIVNDLKRLRASLPEAQRAGLQIVLVSFDTARDTPAALRAFRARMDLDAGWTLLRGESDAVQDLAMLLGVKFKADARGQFAHSNIITVLNAEGEIVHQVAGLNADLSEAALRTSQLAAK